ncbi:phytoene/squalene synthase family protein [Phreatobacter sp.]|uniref:phytoene/squalene synthase family protein n=1 Tax=Phreatobacter sp. TaxID=1966341 RepID=UPI003F6F6BB9
MPQRSVRDDLDQAFSHCTDVVRAGHRDAYLSALFVPDPFRRDLMALHAYALELAGVRERVSEPLPGEVRLQWWRDALTDGGAGGARGHPVARAVLDAVARRRLPIGPLVAMSEARIADLYDDLFPTVDDYEGHAGETAAALLQLCALVLADGADPGLAVVAGHAGVALAIRDHLIGFAADAARGTVRWPADLMALHGVTREAVNARRAEPGLPALIDDMRRRATDHLRAADAAMPDGLGLARAALLPAATVSLDLAFTAAMAGAPFGPVTAAPGWRRQVRLWRSARRLARTGRLDLGS